VVDEKARMQFARFRDMLDSRQAELVVRIIRLSTASLSTTASNGHDAQQASISETIVHEFHQFVPEVLPSSLILTPVINAIPRWSNRAYGYTDAVRRELMVENPSYPSRCKNVDRDDHAFCAIGLCPI
jgi:hypothetical protein